MNQDWQAFLRTQTLVGAPALCPRTFTATTTETGAVCDLSRLSALAITGNDAAGFLHAQLSTDIEQMQPGQVQYSAWCSAKGRVLAVMLVLRRRDGCRLLLPESQVAAFCRRLGMFVLRANVLIQPIPDHVCAGVIGAGGIAGLSDHLDPLPATGRASESAALSVISPPDSTTAPRFLLSGETAAMVDIWRQMAATIPAAADSIWRCADMQAGVPWLTAASTDQFLPQELGLEALHAVSYDKGCYPGQEIIARLHYRGTPQRHLRLLRITSTRPPDVMETLRHVASGRTVATIINTVAETDDQYLVQAVMQTDWTRETGIGFADGTAIDVHIVDRS